MTTRDDQGEAAGGLRPGTVTVLKTDARGRITYVDDVFPRVTGRPAAALLGEALAAVWHERIPRVLADRVREAVRAGEEVFVHLPLRRRGGEACWIFLDLTPTLNEGGELVSCFAVHRAASPRAVARLAPLYDELCDLERTGSETEAARRLAAEVGSSPESLSAYMFALRE